MNQVSKPWFLGQGGVYDSVVYDEGTALSKQVGGDHYKGMNPQPYEVSHAWGLDTTCGDSIRYIARHKLKGGRQDIEKAIHCLQIYLELEYKETPND